MGRRAVYFYALPLGVSSFTAFAHCAQELECITPRKGLRVYQYIDDVLFGGLMSHLTGRT